ncbi:MAG: thiolase family protein [Acidimicrobiales bacterium]
MNQAVLIDAVRSPLGRRRGGLRAVHPVDLAAQVLTGLVARHALDPGQVEDVIMGCVSQTGEQGLNLARSAVLAAGWPETVPGVTLDRQCGSSQQAVDFAVAGVMAGFYDVVVAAGVESMTRVPMGVTIGNGPGLPFGPTMTARYAAAGGLIPQGVAAERLGAGLGIIREDQDAWSLQSHQRAMATVGAGGFEAEIVPIALPGPGTATGLAEPTFRADECIRFDTSAAALAGLPATFCDGGTITAGNSSQLADGASAALITSQRAAERLGLTPRARFVASAVAAADPVEMLTAPIPATTRVLERAGLKLDDVDAAEVSEAFATVVLAWQRHHPLDPARVNPYGGAIALGHPLGASGTRLLATLVHGLDRSGGRLGLQVMCEGGGMANALIIERLGY